MKNNSLYFILQKMRTPFLVIIITYSIAIIGLLLCEGKDDLGNPYYMSIFDAFYFVTYMGSTIGFGETPYEFTYSQRLWVSISIYMTVFGWLYGIGSVVSLLQDKNFISEINRGRFVKSIKNLNDNFIIVVGYTEVTKKIIEKILASGIKAVVIESNINKVNELRMEDYTPKVPVLHTKNNYSIQDLEMSGIKKFSCRAIISLFNDDEENLRIALISKLLNPKVKIAVRSTTFNNSENLKDLNAEIIVNPFSIISAEIDIAMHSPNLFKLEKWLYRLDNLGISLPKFPEDHYIICGYGRMGKKIYKRLKEKSINVKLVEINKEKISGLTPGERECIIFDNADDKDVLESVNIKTAKAILAITNDDTINISILKTAKKLNPGIITIVRVNTLENAWIFKKTNIDHIFIPSKILIRKITNALINPLSDLFIKEMLKKDELWASKLVGQIIKDINDNPNLVEVEINEKKAPQIFNYLENEDSGLALSIFNISLRNKKQKNNVIALLLKRKEEIILLPNDNMEIKKFDKILLACDDNALDHIGYICENIHEFKYALTGYKEEKNIYEK